MKMVSKLILYAKLFYLNFYKNVFLLVSFNNTHALKLIFLLILVSILKVIHLLTWRVNFHLNFMFCKKLF